MPQGDKSSYTPKQKRQARHIERSEERRGRGSRSAARIAWATVNKQDGGGKAKRPSRTKRGKSATSRRKASRRPTRSRVATRSRSRPRASSGRRRSRTVRSRA